MPQSSSVLPDSWPPAYPVHWPVLTATARSWDQRASQAGIEPHLLMELAARGVAAIAALLVPQVEVPVVVVSGPGHNGGDGYAAARHLAGWGRRVEVVALGPEPTAPSLPPDVRRAAALCVGAGVPVHAAASDPGALPRSLAGAGLVVDALLGIGLVRPLDGAFLEAVDLMNAARGLRLSVDLPSGMEADGGAALPRCVQAHATATMAAPKAGFAPGRPGALAAGRVVEIDIGLPWAVHAPAIRAAASHA